MRGVADRSVSGRSLYGKYRLKGKPKVWRSVWTVTKGAVQDFDRDDVMTKAAALAFYSTLGIAPTVLLVLTVTAWLRPGAEEAVVNQVESMVVTQAYVRRYGSGSEPEEYALPKQDDVAR